MLPLLWRKLYHLLLYFANLCKQIWFEDGRFTEQLESWIQRGCWWNPPFAQILRISALGEMVLKLCCLTDEIVGFWGRKPTVYREFWGFRRARFLQSQPRGEKFEAVSGDGSHQVQHWEQSRVAEQLKIIRLLIQIALR